MTTFPTSPSESVLMIRCLLGFSLALGFATQHTAAVAAQQHVPGLGTIVFPTSGSAAAQSDFVRGVLLLHSFEYEDAAAAFQNAQKSDPGFAMAYWGEAMTYNHPVWMEQNRDAAMAALARLAPTPEARRAKVKSPRERRWLEAVEVLYGTVAPALNADKETRDDLYRDAMRRFHAEYPDDPEVTAFYALSILGTAHEGRDFATYMRAAAVVDPVFRANPDHPGAAHYLIHSYDDPIHAPLGLPMARAYSKIAPGAAHAQHMTSHIFVAMGMWDDVITANVSARDAQNTRMVELGRTPRMCGHYTYWLEYGYLQAGRIREARDVMDACYADVQTDRSANNLNYFPAMRARYVIDTGDWTAAARYGLAVSGGAAANYDFIDALVALEQGDAGSASKVQQRLAEQRGTGPVLAKELKGLMALRADQADEAVGLLQEASADEASMPYEFGPPAIVMPAYELLGKTLLELGRAEEAVAAYRTQLDRTPQRTTSLLGLARAHAAAGDVAAAQNAYARLIAIWHAADPGYAPLVEAREKGGMQRPTSNVQR